MITHVVSGHPSTVKDKRILRIQEAIAYPLGTREKPTHNVVTKVNEFEVYFDKPGKEYFREGTAHNPHDMSPNVGELYTLYSFSDIWKDLLNLSSHISETLYKQFLTILYRMAYLLDHTIIESKFVRFNPSEQIMQIINTVQAECDNANFNFRALEFLYFIDMLSWNEDVKYQSDLSFNPARKGRINNVLSLISIPLIFKNFTDTIVRVETNNPNIDYSLLIDVAQQFARTRGVSPLSNVKLIEYLSPYLID